jgi:SPOR domain
MRQCRPAGSDDPVLQATSMRSSNWHADAMNSQPIDVAHEQHWPPHAQQNLDKHRLRSPGARGKKADSRDEGPRFARLHASLAEARHFNWANQCLPEMVPAQGESRQGMPAAAKAEGSGWAWWLGGAAFAGLAAGIIVAVASVQSSRPLPFETWARRDLMHRQEGLPGAAESLDAAMAAGNAHGTDGLGLAAHAEPVTAQTAPAAARQIGGPAAIGARDVGAQSEVEIAALGTVLASATAADELAANPPTPLLSAPSAVIERRAEPRIGTTPLRAPEPTPPTQPDGPAEPATPAPAVAFDLEVPTGTAGPLQLVSISGAPAKVIAPQQDRALPATSTAVQDDFRVQLAALRDAGNVSYVWHDFIAAFGPLANGLQRIVVQANTRSGVFHLVQIGPLGDLEHATLMCSEIRRRGHDCAVVHVAS